MASPYFPSAFCVHYIKKCKFTAVEFDYSAIFWATNKWAPFNLNCYSSVYGNHNFMASLP
jgi:hypothetical protein